MIIRIFKKPYFISAFLVIFFFISVHFFLTSHNRFALSEKKMRILERQVKILKQQQRDIRRKKRIMLNVKNFVDNAKSFGLEEKRWAYYNVYLEQPISFQELQRVASQAVSTSHYYFKPETLSLKTTTDSDSKIQQSKSPSTSADSLESKKGDLLITLKGAFMVKQE